MKKLEILLYAIGWPILLVGLFLMMHGVEYGAPLFVFTSLILSIIYLTCS